ncbi:hypothetical protein Vi05172_g8010 [Venturia inaequalis]|nr:hypothetical protein Vi05172_g8010 [Venturia inaequalis]
MMRKKVVYTQVTPIPSYIPRQLAIDLLHNHAEIINLNPLVLNHVPIKAPRDAPADEFYSTWYEIEERIQYIPGTGNMGSGRIKFRGCFHDMPWGIQTHMYAPMNIDLRNKWRVAGNQPGEPREPTEMGIGAPNDGLYLREDVEIKANFTMISFVKKEMKAAAKKMVDRLVKKAELLDAGLLQAMFENGRLTTINPADRTNNQFMTGGGQTPPRSPRPQSAYASPIKSYPLHPPTQPHPATMPSRHSSHASSHSYGGTPYNPGGIYAQNQPHNQQSVIMELPGDYPGMPPPQPHQQTQNAHLHPQDNNRQSVMSELSADSPNGDSPQPDQGRWSNAPSSSSHYAQSSSSRPNSYATDTTGGMRSPRFDQNGFAPMHETKEEHEGDQAAALKRLEGQRVQSPQTTGGFPQYNPADYA